MAPVDGSAGNAVVGLGSASQSVEEWRWIRRQLCGDAPMVG
jgi:hypothetical protein